MSIQLYRITLPETDCSFVIEVFEKVVVNAAPIAMWMLDKDIRTIKLWTETKQGTIKPLKKRDNKMAKLQFTPESIVNTYKVVDEGLYWITLTGFKPKAAKPKDGQASDSINFNPVLELTSMEDGSPAPKKDDGKPIPVFCNLNTKGAWVINDFCHGFGLPMQELPNGALQIPGIWVPEAEDDISKCEYKGPLIGRKAKVFLTKGEYNNKQQNKIKYFVCAVQNCSQKFPKIKHSTDLK